MVTCCNQERSKNSKNKFPQSHWSYRYKNSKNINPNDILNGY